MERWRYRSSGGIGSSPAVSDGLVYATGRDGYLDALDAATGAVAWRTVFSRRLGSSPMVSGDRVYAESTNGAVTAFDKGSGAIVWVFDTGAEAGSSPVIVDGVVYVGTGRDYRGRGEGFLVAIGGS